MILPSVSRRLLRTLFPPRATQNSNRFRSGTPINSGRFRQAVNTRKKRRAAKRSRCHRQGLYPVCLPRRRSRAPAGGRGGLLHVPALRHQHRHQFADCPESGLAPARPAVRPRLRPRRDDSRGRRGQDAGDGDRGGGRALCQAEGQQDQLPVDAAARHRRVLREERPVVPADRGSRQDHRPVRIRSAPDRDHGRRSLDPRPDRRAGDRACRRQARPGQARQHRAAVQPDRRDGRDRAQQGQCELLLARARQRPAAVGFGQARLHRVQADPRLQRAGARQGRDRRDPQGRGRSGFPDQIPGAGAADRPGADRQRGIRHRPGRRRRQRHRHGRSSCW